MKNLILFDLDGTLSQPRKLIQQNVIISLKKLSNISKIGILTGSGFEYVIEQCEDAWKHIGSIYPERIILLPCNGTQVYEWKNQEWANIYNVNMIQALGQKDYNVLVKEILSLQSFLVNEYDIPLTGEFVSYRKSMINWCPSGRHANTIQRQEFIDIDNNIKLRKMYLSTLVNFCTKNDINVTCVLGGQTSFDIYPTGWDKRYALKHFTDHNMYFVGDRCTGDGNDKTIYDALLPQSFMTNSPENTIEIIKNKLIPLINETSN
jgi:phosphomannomutase